MERRVARPLELGANSGALTARGREPHDEAKRHHERNNGNDERGHEHDARKELNDYQQRGGNHKRHERGIAPIIGSG